MTLMLRTSPWPTTTSFRRTANGIGLSVWKLKVNWFAKHTPTDIPELLEPVFVGFCVPEAVPAPLVEFFCPPPEPTTFPGVGGTAVGCPPALVPAFFDELAVIPVGDDPFPLAPDNALVAEGAGAEDAQFGIAVLPSIEPARPVLDELFTDRLFAATTS